MNPTTTFPGALTHRGRRAVLAAAAAGIAVLTAAGSAVASSDPFFSQQWGLAGAPASINAPSAWCAGTGAGILVADVDTGVDWSHPDLAGRLVAGARFTNGDGSETGPRTPANLGDGVGHGTGTTGLMVANKDDGVGIAGVAPSARAMVVKVFDDSGSGNTTDAAAGIRFAATHGARVINISLGADPTGAAGVHASVVPDSQIVSAIQYAANMHVAVVASAGNNQTNVPVSQYTQITKVALVAGAVGRNGEAAWYTTTGAGVNIYAPGGDDPNDTGSTALNIVTPYKGGQWVSWQGTSFAAPHVAGTLALLMSRGLSAEAARQRILDSAVKRSGLPELDAAAALGSSAGCPASGTAGSAQSGPAPGPRGGAGPGHPTAGQPVAGATAQPATAPAPSIAGAASPTAETAANPTPIPRSTPGSTPARGTPGGRLPAPLLAVGLLGGLGAAYWGLRLVTSLR